MANDLNQCNFIGRLGKEPEVRFMPSGDAVANFSIAIGSSWKDKNSGEKRENTEWVNIVAFGKLAEICGEFLVKGTQVHVTSKVKTEKYTDKEGIEKYATKFIAESVQMLGSKPSGDNEAPRPAPAAAPAQSKPAPKFSDMDDDIPFN
jgi:single-strand DNA-binding protein